MKILQTNLDGIANCFLTAPIEKGDYAIFVGQEELYKFNGIDKEIASFSPQKFFIFPKETFYSFEQWTVKVGHKKYKISDKLSKGQKVFVDGFFYEVTQITKMNKTQNEVILSRIQPKKAIQVYTVKKVDTNNRNRVGQFNKEVVGTYTIHSDALIALTHLKMNNQEKEIAYSL